MSVQLNHTIVACRDQQRSAAFLTGILGLPPATRFGHFLVVEADNSVSHLLEIITRPYGSGG